MQIFVLLVFSLLSLSAFAQEVNITEGVNCLFCEPNEKAVVVSTLLAPAYAVVELPPCKDNLQQELELSLQALPKEAGFVLESSGAPKRFVSQFLDNMDRDIHHQIANRLNKTVSSCALLVAILPEGASYMGFGLSLIDANSQERYYCNLQTGFCDGVAFIGFTMTPGLLTVGGRQLIFTEARNYNSDTVLENKAYFAELTVYFRP